MLKAQLRNLAGRSGKPEESVSGPRLETRAKQVRSVAAWVNLLGYLNSNKGNETIQNKLYLHQVFPR
jgi:hypothetical protein